jgi:hypothetical protein
LDAPAVAMLDEEAQASDVNAIRRSAKNRAKTQRKIKKNKTTIGRKNEEK